MTKEFLDRYLPKWPQMLVWGKPVTEEQAIEVIRRTDSFFLYGGGNDRNYNRRIRSVLGLPKSYSYLADEEIKQEFKEVWSCWDKFSIEDSPKGWNNEIERAKKIAGNDFILKVIKIQAPQEEIRKQLVEDPVISGKIV